MISRDGQVWKEAKDSEEGVCMSKAPVREDACCPSAMQLPGLAELPLTLSLSRGQTQTLKTLTGYQLTCVGEEIGEGPDVFSGSPFKSLSMVQGTWGEHLVQVSLSPGHLLWLLGPPAKPFCFHSTWVSSPLALVTRSWPHWLVCLYRLRASWGQEPGLLDFNPQGWYTAHSRFSINMYWINEQIVQWLDCGGHTVYGNNNFYFITAIPKWLRHTHSHTHTAWTPAALT